MGNMYSQGGDTSQLKTNELIKEYLSKRKSLENTVVSFLRSVVSLQTAAEYFARQLKEHHEVDNSKETYKAAIKVLLSSQELNVDTRISFVKDLVEFFESIQNSIKKACSIPLPDECRTCAYLQSYNDPCTGNHYNDIDGYIDNEIEIHRRGEENENLRKEIENLKKQIDNDKQGSTSCVDGKDELLEYVKKSREHDRKRIEMERSITRLNETIEQLKQDKIEEHKRIGKLEEDIKKGESYIEGNKQLIDTLVKENTEDLQNLRLQLSEKCQCLSESLHEKDNEMQILKTEIENNKSYIAELDVKSKSLQKEKDHLLKVHELALTAKDDKLEKLSTKKRNQNARIEELEEKFRLSSESLDQKDMIIQTLRKEIENKTADIANLDRKNESLETENDDLYKKHESCQSALTAKDNKMVELSTEIRNQNASISKLTENNKRLKEAFDQKDMDMQTMKKEIGNINADIVERDMELVKLREDIRQQKRIIMTMEAETEKQKSRIEKLTKDCNVKDREKIRLDQELKQFSDKCRSKEKELVKLQENVQEVRSKMEKTSDELRLLKSKILIRVNLFCHHRSNIITNIEHELMAILKSKIDENHVELVFEQLADTPDSDTDPTIALCMTASRIGTDAENAVKELNMSSKTALLMIHHKDEHALPQQSSERVLTGPGFKKLGCISDMAFLSGKGFFSCEINNSSIVRLVSFIKKEGIKYRKYQS